MTAKISPKMSSKLFTLRIIGILLLAIIVFPVRMLYKWVKKIGRCEC